MKRRGISVTLLLLSLTISVLAGCSNYGKLRLQAAAPERMTPQELARTWTSYDVYYSGLNSSRPSAVLFDPKGDRKSMTVHPWWIKVTDQVLLQEIMNSMIFYASFDPVVWRVLGPNDDFYGYLYTAWNRALIRVVDEDTLWIDEMSNPPSAVNDGGSEKNIGFGT